MPTFSPVLQKKTQSGKRRHNMNESHYSYPICNRICSRAEADMGIENRKIAVENHDFSTLSTDFSTGLFHREIKILVCILVYISYSERIRQFFHFFAAYQFHNAKIGAEKKVLTSAAYRQRRFVHRGAATASKVYFAVMWQG